ncbi:hypothetical protein [Salegentibacter sp. Hel_I_6]|uniref:hypothetical protein n=1 Tax=Salegentibacter sp. Hel_I_6 TaxID=1250278 RepID=UPI00055DACD8|nr:hypothetical protein [Salegentibacter sp. Hel_I_6]
MKIKKFLEKYSEKPPSTFSRLFITFLFGILPFTIIFGLLTIAGIEPVTLNGKDYYGFAGLLVLLIATPITASVFAIFIYLYLLIGFLMLNGLKKLLVR